MNTRSRFTFTLTLVLLAAAAGVALVAVSLAAPAGAPPALGAPTVVAYQGEVRVSNAPYSGDGFFKFAIVDADGRITYWSNDGTSTNGDEPKTAVRLPVSDGLFSVLLGDTRHSGMTEVLRAEVFSGPDRYLRVWFSTRGTDSSFSPLAPDTRVAAVPYALQSEEAVNSDTVDGLHADELAGYQNVVVVAKGGGDYTSVQAAIGSITDAAAGNPYLVWVAPGVYEEQVTMVPYVHLQGAGQELTVISSTASTGWPPAQATLQLASDTSVRDLTVGNRGAGAYNVALLATTGMTRTLVADVTARAQGAGAFNYALFLRGSGTGVRLERVSALAENGSSFNNGLSIAEGAAATLRGGSFTGRGGSIATGVYSHDSGTRLEAESITALGEDSSNQNFGLQIETYAAVTLRGGSFTGYGGEYARGIYMLDSGSTLEAEGITVRAKDGNSNNWGLRIWEGTASVTHSVLDGADWSVYNTSGSGTVSHSRLVGGAATGVTCVAVSRDTTFSADICP